MTINKPAHPAELLCRGGRERLVFLQFLSADAWVAQPACRDEPLEALLCNAELGFVDARAREG